ncbi:FtsX-like permease family protein [Devosia sp. J2-20]|uniref:ABC transporter permease n=1 Tax=Devosia sp. J2-20 TaxID=3026161 RepID=UPI00249C40D2|nr:FtsX-like permease family protein [Devosia sp. J2-20]WDQ97950.1 FtsX-like permease family protein [Devosia sp. J2-20]
MRVIWATVRIGLLDLRGDMRRFILLLVCLAVGTALIAGVNSVGASITQAIDRNAAELMGGDLELSRADRPATSAELAQMLQYGQVAAVVDTNVRAQSAAQDAFVDLAAVGDGYPLLGRVVSPQLAGGTPISEFLAPRDDLYGALLAPVLLDQLGLSVGDSFELGGTTFQARGTLTKLPDGPVRGFRLGLTTVVTNEGLASLRDRSSPLPGLGNWFRYKLLLNAGQDVEMVRAALDDELGATGWSSRTARDGLGPMVRYYDLFMRFLVIVGLGSLMIAGVSVWTSMRAYISERSSVIAILRSLGAEKSRVMLHFFTQVTALAAIGVGAGLLVGGVAAYVVLPAIGEAVGIELAPSVHLQPLLVAGGAGFLTAFAFAYLPLQQTQAIRPVTLFQSRGLEAPPVDWRGLLLTWQIAPLLAIIGGFYWLAVLMTGDPLIVLAFGAVGVLAAFVFHQVSLFARLSLGRVPYVPLRIVRHALRGIAAYGSNAAAVVISMGMALTMLIVVLVLQGNLRQEFLGASSFDVPTLVASDLFPDEVETMEAMVGVDSDIALAVATPMLRGALTAINGVAVKDVRTRGPEATFLLSGEVPLTYRPSMPAASKLMAGEWWAADYSGPGKVSLHHSLRSGLGVDIGDSLTFDIFGDAVDVEIASFRDYSWQGGIDFLATFSPGVLDAYPMTLFSAVTAQPGAEEAAERALATAVPDINFIAVGDTLKQITTALGQLSFAAAMVGGLAVGNGLLVLIGSLATGRRQREADAVITKVLGATRIELLATASMQYLVLAIIASIPAVALGIGLGWLIGLALLDVEFTVQLDALGIVLGCAIAITALLGALTILRATSRRPALLLRDL